MNEPDRRLAGHGTYGDVVKGLAVYLLLYP